MKKRIFAFSLSFALMLGTFGISVPAASAEHILFLPRRGGTFNILGQYNGASIATDFANAYQVVVADQTTGALLSDVEVSVSAEYSDEASLKATILLQNRSKQPITAKLALHSDSKINQSDTAPLFMIPQDPQKAYALRACETDAKGYQCTYQFRNVEGSPDATTVWVGRFDERYDNLWNNSTATMISDMDSGMAISWQNVALPASDSASVSFLVSVEPANLDELPAYSPKPKPSASPAPVLEPLATLPPIKKLHPIDNLNGGSSKVTSDWKSVLNQMKHASAGSVISVTMDQDTLMPAEVLKQLEKIQNISLQVSNENGSSFILNGKSAKEIPSEKPLNLESLYRLAEAEAAKEQAASSAANESAPSKEEAETPTATAKPKGEFVLPAEDKQTGYLPVGDTVPALLGYLRKADVSPAWAPDIQANTGAMDRLYRAVLAADSSSLTAQDRTDCIAYLSQWQQVLGKSPEEADQLAKDLIG